MTLLRFSPLLALAALSAALLQVAAQDYPCVRMGQIYNNGSDLCQRMFGKAFKYVPRSDPAYNLAYTMWWFDSNSPNAATTQRRIQAGLHPSDYQSTDVCWLKTDGVTSHASRPLNQSLSFTECHPYKQNACCNEATVEDVNVLGQIYGDEYRWDRCGPISQECERFFVQEACFYECDPNAGLFRKYTPAMVAADPKLASETWELNQMPIQGDYCDAWYDACREELFCGDGDFFTCKRYPPPKPSAPLSGGAIAGIVIGGVVLLCLVVFVSVLIRRERSGRPVFQKIAAEDSRPLDKTARAAGASAPGQHMTTV